MRRVNRIKGDKVAGYYKIIREMREAERACEAACLELFTDLEVIVGGPKR